MRLPRRYQIDGRVDQYYHVVNRVVDKRMVFGEREARVFRKMLGEFSDFSGCEVVTFCIMGNHFHLLLKVPRCDADISNEEVWERMGHIYDEERLAQFRREIERFEQMGHDDRIHDFFEKMKRRMYSLSFFMKDLKQKFTKWFNYAHERKGTLWEERFKSLLISPHDRSISRIAAYIDLNPVRAGIVEAPQLYPWSGYSEACRGNIQSQKRLSEVFKNILTLDGWNEVKKEYERLLGSRRDVSKQTRKGNETIRKEGGALTFGALLLCRVREFSNGVAMGSKDFIHSLSAKVSTNASEKSSHSGCGIETSDGIEMRFLRRGRRDKIW